MSNINALMGLGLDDIGQQQAMADRLRGQQNAGNYLSLSSISPISQMGQNILRGVDASATNVGTLNKARTLAQAKTDAAIQGNTWDKETATALAKTKAAAAVNAANVDKDSAQLLATAKKDQNSTDNNFRSGETEAAYFYNPDGSGNVLTLNKYPNNRYTRGIGDNETEVDVTNLKPYTTGTTASTRPPSAQTRKFDKEQADALVDQAILADVAFDVIGNPHFASATGKFDPERFIGESTPFMPEVQSLQRQLKRLSVNSTAPVLQTLGSKPTDFDFEVASSTMPDVSDEVTVWLDWFDDEYIPRMVAAINKGKHPELSSVFEARFRKRLRGARAQERERISKSPMTSAGNVVNDFFKNPTTPQVDDTMTPQAQQEEQDYQDALAKYRKGSDT